MSPTIDVFVIGQESDFSLDPPDPAWPASLRLFPAGVGALADFAKTPRASQLFDGETELVALVVGTDRALFRCAAIQAICLGEYACNVAIETADTDLRSS